MSNKSYYNTWLRGLNQRAAVLAVLGSSVPVAAQSLPPSVASLPSQSDISRERLPQALPETPQFDLRIQAPEHSAVPKAIDTMDFNLKHIAVEGVTAFPADKVDGLFVPLTKHTVHLDEVRAAATALEDMYHARGYFLARVFVPPQRIENGTLTVQVVEGYIGHVHVTGLDAGTQRHAYRMLRALEGRKPIELAIVERHLLILNDLPGVIATTVLRQASEVGASDMYVTLTKARNIVQASVSNTNSRVLGPWTYSLSGNLSRPLGLPGNLMLSTSASGPGFGATESGSVRYSFGLGDEGVVASVGVLAAYAHPGASLIPLDVRNRLVSVSARLHYPIIRSRALSLYIEGGVSVNRSTTDILQQQLSNDKETVADVSLTLQATGARSGSTFATIDLYRGLPIFGALGRSAPDPSVPNFDPNFMRLTYSLQHVQNLLPRVSAMVSVQGQYSTSRLLTGEEVAYGGPAIGRGYDPSTIVGDRGIGGLAELRYDLPLRHPAVMNVQFYAFIDGARATTLPNLIAGKITSSLNSTGVGVRLTQRLVSLDLEAAKALVHYSGGDTRSDPRLLLTLTLYH